MNGLLIQWGNNSPSSGSLQTINFNVNFTTTNYVGFANFIRNSRADTSWDLFIIKIILIVNLLQITLLIGLL